MRCKTCRYSLSGLTEHRCPECGNAFDPNDPYLYRRDTRRGPFGWRELGILAAVAYMVGFFFWRPFGRVPVDMHNAPELEVAGSLAMLAAVTWPMSFLLVLTSWLIIRAAAIRLAAFWNRVMMR